VRFLRKKRIRKREKEGEEVDRVRVSPSQFI
jgi:hypothetical protein